MTIIMLAPGVRTVSSTAGAPGLPPPPTVTVFDPVDRAGPAVPVRITVADTTDATIDLEVRFSKGGGPFAPATPAATSDRMTGLAAPNMDADYKFMWDAATDVGATPSPVPAQLEFTPIRGGVAGAPVKTRIFQVDTVPQHVPASLPPPQPAAALSFDVVSGAGQTGITGQLLPQKIQVRLHDSQGNSITGLAVRFTGGGALGFDIERDPKQPSVTDWSGIAGVRVRVRPGAPGTGWVKAAIVGMLGVVSQQIDFTAQAPQIFHDWQTTTTCQYGGAYTVNIGYDDPVNFISYFDQDPVRPVRFKLEGTNCLLSQSELTLPQSFAAPWGYGLITFVPTVFKGSAEIRVLDPVTAKVLARIPITVDTPAAMRTARVIAPGTTVSTTSTTDDVDLRLAVVSGLTSPTQPQVGYPGLTLAQGLALQILDGVHTTAYANLVTANRLVDCAVTATTVALQISYSVTTGAGGLALTAAGAPQPQVKAQSRQSVFFTPSGPGPWVVTAIARGPVSDNYAVPLQYPDPSNPGQTICEIDHGLDTYLTYAFLIQKPTVKVVAAPYRAPTDPPIVDVRAGDSVQIAFGRISAVAGGTPEPVTAEGLTAACAAVQPYLAIPYTGLAIPFSQSLTVTSQPGGMVVSDALLLTSGQPAITLSGPAITVVANGTFHARAGGCDVYLPVRGPFFDRFLMSDIEPVQEAPVGTSVRAGAAATVLAHSGEFAYTVSDRDLAVPGALLSFARTYRSANRVDGLLGPGWVDEHQERLDVSGTLWIDWINGHGIRSAIYPGETPRGFFVDITANADITADQSAFQIMDAHRNEIHFHPDGLLRFTKDRKGNITRYDYNEKGLPIRITDSLNRQILLSYYQKGDPVDPKVYGKLKLIHDFIGRDVTFEYYGAGDPHGQPGWLKKVSPPKSTVVVNGTQNANYARTETYWYEMRSPDPLDGQLVAIIDSEGRNWITNHYRPSDHRIDTQDMGIGSFKADYDLPNRKTTITDRAGNKVDYHFPESAYWEAATPDQITQHPNPTARPGAPDEVYTLRHNPDGMRLSVTDPAGTVTEHVYDDSQPPRSRGNLLAMRQRAGGVEHVKSYVYESFYNFVQQSFPARANAPGENPGPFATTYVYDYQTNPGAQGQGNLVAMTLPRTLNWTVAPNTSGGFSYRWSDENPTSVYTWNKYGQLTSVTDQGGVVTELAYYPMIDPTGQSSPVPSKDEAGFLASATRDTQVTTDRTRHFAGMPLMPLTNTWRYSALGDLLEEKDPAGIVTRTVTNDLHEVTQIVERAGRPDAVTADLYVNEYGEHARTVLHQPNADAGSGGNQLTEDVVFDATKNLATGSATRTATTTVTRSVQGDSENDPIAYTPPPTQAAPSTYQPGYQPPPAPAGSAVVDEKGRPTAIRDASNVAAPEETDIVRDSTLRTETITWPDATTSSNAFNGRGELIAQTDPRGATVARIPDGGGAPSRASFTTPPQLPGPAVIGAFSEERIDEWGRRKRVYLSRFDVNAIGGKNYAPVPEYFPRRGPWPPAVSSTLSDGRFGHGDGRVASDRQFDVYGLPARFLNDELNIGWVRRDPHGRLCDWSDSLDEIPPYQNFGHVDYDVPNLSAVYTLTEHSTDATATVTKVFTHKEQCDPEGRIVAVIDGEGNAAYRAYDEAGHLVQAADAMGDLDPNATFNGAQVNKPGNVTTYARDGLGHIRYVETTLTVDGTGGHAPDPNRTYNSDGLIHRGFIYDDASFFRGYADHDDQLTIVNYDEKGRLKTVLNGPCNASGVGPTTFSRTYDGNGRIDTVTDANGVTLKYSYDGAGRVDTIKVQSGTTPGTQELHFHYDGYGNVDLAEDRTTGHQCAFTYDSQRLMRTATVNGALTLTCDYDGAGRRILTRYPGGGDVVHVFDRAGRLRGVKDGGQTIATFEYLGMGRVTKRAVQGVTSTFDYTPGSGRLKGVTVAGLINPTTIGYTIGRDRTGRITSVIRNAAGPQMTRKWTFDSVGRIVAEEVDAPPAWPYGRSTDLRQYDGNNVLRQEDIAYAPVGAATPIHRTRKPEERGRVVFDDALPNTIPLYDKNGALTSLGDHIYAYDAFGRLDHVDYLGATLATYQYDALNRLVKRTGPAGQVEEFTWDGWRLLEVRLGGAVTERYVYGTGLDDPLTVELNAQRHVILHSPEGSVDGLVDPGRNAEFYHYSLGGDVTLLEPDLGIVTTRAAKSRMLLHGGFWDPAAKAYYFRRRWYSPTLEQFFTLDPMGFAQSSNQYGFCLADPINKSDPFGCFDIQMPDPVAGVKAAFGAGKAVVEGMLFEPVLAIWDAWGMFGETLVQGSEVLTGWTLPIVHGYRHVYRSGVGKMINNQKMGYGDLFAAMWDGIVGTPERIYEAASRGDAEAFGYEAMNAYMLGRSAQQIASGALRMGINVAARWSWISTRTLTSIRNAQLRLIAARMRLRAPDLVRPPGKWLPRFRNPFPRGLPRVEYCADFVGDDFAQAEYSPRRNVIRIYESAFRPGDVELPENYVRAPQYRGWGPIGGRQFIKGGTPENAVLHEMYHAYQRGLSPGDFDAIYSDYDGSGPLDMGYENNPIEFTQGRDVSNPFNEHLAGHRIIGAHNYAWAHAPATPFRRAFCIATWATNSINARER